jgi:hypothetical protein
MSNRDKRAQQQPRSRRGKAAPPTELCVYCGIRPAVDREHVIARCIFDVVPDPPIIVPTCVECNSGRGDGVDRKMSMDEEYMRQVLGAMQGVEDHPVGRKLVEGPVRRCFDHSPALAVKFLKTTSRVWARNQQGILSPALTWVPEWHRIERVLRKIVKGLFFHFMKRRLLSDSVIKVKAQLNQELQYLILKTVMDLSHIGPLELGNGAVIIVGGRAAAEADDTVWLLHFYGCYSVAMWTTSKANAEAELAGRKAS